MTTDNTAHPAPTPAPVAVPEGGWRSGDWFMTERSNVYRLSADGRWYVHGEGFPPGFSYGATSFEDWVVSGKVVYVHAPREDARPEPVAAPLPTEAVEAASRAWADSNYAEGWSSIGNASRAVIRENMRVALDAARRPDRLVPADDEALSVQVDKHRDGATFVRIERQGVPLVIGYVHPEPPADDEDTVRVLDRVRQAVARHPDPCEKRPDGDGISCGWKSAYRDVVIALNGADQ